MGEKTLTEEQIKLCEDPEKQLRGVKIHEAADFPMIGAGQEFQDFVLDILINGQKKKVVYWNGELLDGRNRYAAAKILGRKCKSESKNGNEIKDPYVFAWSENVFRRHLTTQQRAMEGASLVVKRRAWLMEQDRLKEEKYKNREQDKEREKARKEANKSVNTDPPPEQEGRIRDRAARAVGASGSSVGKAGVIMTGGSKELISAVKNNKVGLDLGKAIVNAFPNKAAQNRVIKQTPVAIRAAIQRELANKSKVDKEDPKRHQRLARSKAQKTIEAAVRSVDDYHAVEASKGSHKIVVSQLQMALKNLWAVR